MSFRFFIAPLILFFLSACAGIGGLSSVSKTNQLSPGMKPAEVKQVLGDPSQTQFISNKWVWKYSLHEPWKGFIPYYMVFGRESQSLEQWFPDEAEYMRQQQLWLQAFPPTQRYDVDVRIKQPTR
ncbi:MAG: hypothetical protein CVU30_06330 [Betaproteobacteria bacterium HGW-Betaproteobacteria-3]|nr:MAG: hypothetical protein CVU30_06330 [Betaproteobacteria bacterium HGW-Betaproteobacteria-3]